MHLEYRSGPCHDPAAYASIRIAYAADRIFGVALGDPAACRFYQACGFSLRAALPGVYPDFPDEIMLLGYKPLSGPGEALWR